MQADHDAARAEWETMLARRDSDSKQFLFTVRGCEGPGLSGSIPRQVFEAEQDSALAHMYNGEWEYNKDANGRATVNSNPAHWPAILDWLSFGTVPSHPTPEFLSECSFWQLDRLLSALADRQHNSQEELDAVSSTEKNGHDLVIKKVVINNSVGFELQGHICRCQQRIAEAYEEALHLCVPFSAIGRDWQLRLSQKGCFLFLNKGLPLHQNLMRFGWGSGENTRNVAYTNRWHHKAGGCGYGERFDKDSLWYANPELVSVDGRMPLTLVVTFSPSKP